MSPPRKTTDVDLGAIDDVISNLQQEFLVDASDTLGDLGLLVTETRAGKVDAGYTLQTVRREIHTLKGQGTTFGFPAVTAIAHRLENYLHDLETLDAGQFDDILQFVDRMQAIADSGVNPEDEDFGEILRALPVKGAATEDDQQASEREILLVAASRVVRRAIEQELGKRGFRVVTLESPIDVFETVIRTRPDMVIASAVMDQISGIDLARALKSMTATRHIPFALLTSFDVAHPELRNLPDDVALVHHDRDINAELDKAVRRLVPPV